MEESEVLNGRRHRRSGDDRVPWKGIAIGLLSIALGWASTEWYRAKDAADTASEEHRVDHDALTRTQADITYIQRDLGYVTKKIEENDIKQDERWFAITKALGIPTSPKSGDYERPPTPKFGR